MRRITILVTMCALALAIACSGEDKQAATDGAAQLQDSASDMMKKAEDSAGAMAHDAKTMAHDAAGSVAQTAVEACRKFAETGAWEQALDACRKAHELMPDDLGLEHAFQQAQAAAGN